MAGGKFTGMSCEDFGHGAVGNILTDTAAVGAAAVGTVAGGGLGALVANAPGAVAVGLAGGVYGAEAVLDPNTKGLPPGEMDFTDSPLWKNKYGEPVDSRNGRSLISPTEKFIKNELTTACKLVKRLLP